MDQIPQSYRRQQDKQGVKMEQRVAEGRWQGERGQAFKRDFQEECREGSIGGNI